MASSSELGGMCQTHGPLDPSWTRCPHCLREGREGRLLSGQISLAGAPSSHPEQPPPPFGPKAALPAGQMVGGQGILGPSETPHQQPPQPPLPAAQTPPPARRAAAREDQPRSSVGATFAIRRRPRLLAYLVEREGEAVGRVHQLEDETTDIGRDPRNVITLGDVLVSGFHARVERTPDGRFIAEDRGSTNGSFLNGEPLTDMRPMEENDALRVGNTTLVLKIVP